MTRGVPVSDDDLLKAVAAAFEQSPYDYVSKRAIARHVTVTPKTVEERLGELAEKDRVDAAIIPRNQYPERMYRPVE